MPTAPSRRVAPILLTAAALLYTALGLILIPLAGIQDDEALFAAPLFTPPFLPYTLTILRHHPPLMVFPYTGALKTYLYWPIFKLFAPGPYSLRVPVLLAGVVTIFVFYLFAQRITGPRAAIIAAVLLASDPTFLMSNTFDWGPVALQHLLLIAGCYLFARGNIRTGCFVFGLALWEKSVFVWSLAGLTVAVLVAYLPEVRAVLTDKRRITQAVLAFLIGASPLIVYNIKSKNETIRSTAHLSLEQLPVKAEELYRALNGGGLFRFIAAEPWESDPKPAVSLHTRIAAGIHDFFGDRRASLFPWALLLALLVVPLWWRAEYRKPALFAIVVAMVTFVCMAVTRDAGVGIHHSVLLWPMPQLLVGIVLAALPLRWPAIAVTLFLALSNLLVTNQYIFQLDRYGADGGFTDALYPLSAQLPTTADDKLYVMDWGLTETLTLLHKGALSMLPAADPFFTATPDPVGLRMISNMLTDPHGLFVGHVREREVFAGVSERLEAAAHAAGYQKQMVQLVTDSNAHPVFELFRFRK